MPDTLDLYILKELIPTGLDYGTNLLVEFQPDSIWYETSLTIAADAIKQSVKTEYHSFQHVPNDIKRALTRLGLDRTILENEENLRIIDDYTGQIDPSTAPRSLKLADWSINIVQRMKAGRSEGESLLHVDDNTAVLTRYNPESSVVDWFRTRAVPITRTIERVAIHGLLTGVASEAFYRQIESVSDGIIDFRTEEKEGRIEQYIRVRIMRGKSFDSRWHRLAQLDNGQVTLTT